MITNSVANIRTGARGPVKKKGKMKKLMPSPLFKRATPKPKMMNPIVIRYSSLFFKCNTPLSLEPILIYSVLSSSP